MISELFRVRFELPEVKSVMKQMFNGLFYIHSNKIIHRDMKGSEWTSQQIPRLDL